MKLSNQNICNLRGCQMPLGGANNFGGGTPHHPRKSVPECGGITKRGWVNLRGA